MASKKTLMVNFGWITRRRWSLSLDGTDSGVLDDLRTAIEAAEKKHGVTVVNAAKPFSEAKMAEKKKDRKPRSDKGATKGHAVHDDGQVAGQ